MKPIYPIWLIIFHFIILAPYILKLRTWNFTANLTCIALAILILANIIYILVNRSKKHRSSQ
jgi:hypothetical protein